MQINHNIRAMVTQHALFQNNNAMTKSLEKLSTGLRINRAQDDAAGLAMSEQMRSQIRGFGKAKQNSQDGQAALQIAEGALGEITNMMQRQKELAVQSANDTLTSTERMYLNDEFQALTNEIDRIAKTTDYNGKNVLLFDMDPNKSFGATKLNPYNVEISTMEASNTIYKVFGEYLTGGGLSQIGGSELNTYAWGDTTKYPTHNAASNVDNKPLSYMNENLKTVNDALDKINAIVSSVVTGKGTFTYTAMVNGTEVTKTYSFVGNGILHEDNIEDVLKAIVSYSNVKVATVNVKGSGNDFVDSEGYKLDKALADGGSRVTVDILLGGDQIWTGAINANEDFKDLSAADQKALKDANAFLKAAQDALNDIQSAKKGEADTRGGADVTASNILKAFTVSYSDMAAFSSLAFEVKLDNGTSQLQSVNLTSLPKTGINLIDDFSKALVSIAGQMAAEKAYAAQLAPGLSILEKYTSTIAAIANLFNSATGEKAYQQLMQIDTSKMESGTLENGTTGEKIKMLQKVMSGLHDAVKIYNEGATAEGTAASDILHVTPNYSRGLGGFQVSEIKVNYTAVDVRGLGLQAQNIDSQRGATRAIDRLDETIKVISSNRAAIGTYINRLDYTINNIASMEYNTQDAESRIRDTDFSSVTTDFTKNQIMVQSATSMLAQANSLPQAVLGLLG